MNVKKYRAATTREALEKIKNDLGEDAFVLETKQVRSKGFLGFRGENQIEVSAVAPEFIAKQKTREKKTENKVFNPNSILNLTDDSAAEPSTASKKTTENAGFFNALKLRAGADENIENVFPDTPSLISSKNAETNQDETILRETKEIDAVEISTEAPKIVHKRKSNPVKIATAKTRELPLAAVPAVATTTTASSSSVDKAAVATAISKQDLEIIRAELREVKHSISAFATRQNVQLFSGEVDLESFGEIYDSPFYDSYIELTATGLKPEIVRNSLAEIIPQVKQELLKASEISETVLYKILNSALTFEKDPLQNSSRSILAVIGATGVGKTTTVAKLAARFGLHEGRRVELVTLDTYRIAAVEQLKTYAQIIGAGCHVVRSVFELDAILNRLPDDVTVLIDTTGKNPHDLADQYEVSDYLKKHKEIRKCLAVQATMHPIDGIAAIKKFEMYGADCLALTKIDETTRPGALLDVISQSSLPLVYCCNGQRVPEDLHPANSETFISQILHKKINPLAIAA